MTQVHDLAVLGGGPAGYATALRAAQLGLDVTLVEERELGGTCLHRGCVPTKAWLQAAKTRTTVAKADRLGIGAILTGVDATKVRGFADSLVSGLHRGLTGLIRSRGIRVVPGHGRLVVDAEGPALDVDGELLRARNVVLATGSAPVTLGLPTDGERILTSEHALRLERLPGRAVILGGGVIGVEFASLWRDLGVEVVLVEAAPHLLPNEDPDLVAVLERRLGARGIDLRLGAKAAGIVRDGDQVRLELPDGTVTADVALIAVGRRPVTGGLGLEEAGVALTSTGHVSATRELATTAAGVFAVGDLIAGPQLAHRGYAHGIFLAEHLAHLSGGRPIRPRPPEDRDIPRITYSSPQLASVGLTREQAAATGGCEVSDFDLRGNARALMLAPGDRDAGLVRVIRRPGGALVGVHVVGEDIAELIAEGTLMVGWQATPDDVKELVHPHPSLSEALAEANLTLAGSALHMHA